MRKKIAGIALVLYLTGAFSTTYANTDGTLNTSQVKSEATSATLTIEYENAVETQEEVVVDKKEIEDSAGVLPDSLFYSIERGIEQLQLAITQSEEKLAALKSQFATERAAEAVIMTNEDEEELANEATAEYMELLASAAQHINNAIEAKDEAVQTLETLNESYKASEKILKTMLEKVPEDARIAIESALNEQDKMLAAVNGFYVAKEAFFLAKELFDQAKKELEAAKKSGDAEAIRIAEEKVKAAETLKDTLEGLKHAADSAKEEVKRIVEQAEKGIELGMEQIEKANEKMEKI